MKTKICTKCGRELNLNYFNKNKNNKDGLNYWCKECVKKYKKKYYESNKERISKKLKQYAKEHKLDKKDYDKKYREKNKKRIKEVQKQYYERNKETLCKKHKEYAKIYVKNNKKRISEKYSIYREKNKERERRRQKIWQKNNKELSNIRTNRRRARKRKLPHNFTSSQWDKTKEYFNNRCAYCGKKVPLEQEHFIPLSKGGGYSMGNIIPACRACNASKSDKDFFEWYPEYKYYSEERENKILDFLGYGFDEKLADSTY